MSFTSLINLRNCRVTRNTNIILEETEIIAAPLVDRQPPRAACLQIEISGCSDGTGTVTVNGTTLLGGAGDSDVFTFTANGIEEGARKEFTHIDSIATLGFIGEVVVGDIEIKAATKTGQPIYSEIEIFEEMNCWIDMHRGGVSVIIPGGVITGITKLFCKHDPANLLVENDFIYYDGKKYRIEFIEWCASRAEKIHHLELILERVKIE